MWIGLFLEGASNAITSLPLIVTAPIAILGIIALAPLGRNINTLLFLIACTMLLRAGWKAVVYLERKFPDGIINDLLAVCIVILFLASLILLMFWCCYWSMPSYY